MNKLISPKYQMSLVKEIDLKIWTDFSSYKDVLFYIKKWHKQEGYNFNDYWENFEIKYSNDQNIDLKSTLHGMQGEDLIKIAIDLGIETPDFIPITSTFKNVIKEQYENVYDIFMKALNNIEEEPDLAIGLANSAFESLIKEIMKDERIAKNTVEKDTLYKLTQKILKEFNISNESFPKEVKTISTALLSISQSIEKLRSEKTNFHGKIKDDIIIDDSIYVYLIVNSITTLGLFLNSYYEKKYPKQKFELQNKYQDNEELPF